MPQFLFTSEFSQMSNDARVLYTLMLDRHRASIRNNWFDENGEVFIYFKREKMQEQLNLSKNTIGKIVKELKSFELVDEKQQGLSKPNKIYLLAPSVSGDEIPAPWSDSETWDSKLPNSVIPDSQNVGFKNPNNCASELPNFAPAESQNLTPSNSDFNNNKPSNNKFTHNSDKSCQNSHGELEELTIRVKENIGYNDFAQSRAAEIELVNNFIDIIIDTIFTQAATVRIGKEDKPLSVVKSVFLKLSYRDIDHAINQFKNVTEHITNKTKYIRTMLYNCKLEGDAHYTNAYMADRYNE
jgi:hypothetical protein